LKSRKIAFTLLAGFTLITFGYFFYCVNFLISDSYTVIEGASLDKLLPFGITSHEDTLKAGSEGRIVDGNFKSDTTLRTVTLKAFDLISVKEVSVNTVVAPKIYPSGQCIGIKMFSKGLVVSGFTDFETEDGMCISPGAAAGLKAGDVITAINGVETSSVKEFTQNCDNSDGFCTLSINRNGRDIILKVCAKKCVDGHMRMGIYVKNSIAGVGTLTYVTQNENHFGALGHGISDYGTLVPMQEGTIYNADVIDIKKGERGVPGEVIGSIGEEEYLGRCLLNTESGIYGSFNVDVQGKKAVEAASSSEIERGKATILCTIDTNDTVNEYDVEIVNINRIRQNKTKSFSIRVIDDELTDMTGGIIQGMSGSPIIQNGKLVGAVTHVFVNDPTRGYGIFIENMLAEAEKIK